MQKSLFNAAASFDRFLWKREKIASHPQEKIVKTSLADIRIRDTGQHIDTLVFLCDPPITIESYDDLIQQFFPEYRIIIVELPGFGFSKPHSGAALNFSNSVTAIESVLLDVLTKPAIICAPCICGFVATELARRKKLDLAGLILMQTPDLNNMQQWQEKADSKRLLRTPFLGQLIIRLFAKKLIPGWLNKATAKDYDSQWMANTTLTAVNRGAAYSLASMFQLWPHGPSDSSVNIPGLIIWGQQDRSHQNTDIYSSKKHFTEVKVIELDDCGHFSELEQPELFANTSKSFIQQVFAMSS